MYQNQQNQQTGSRNLLGPKALPTIWGTYMTLVTKISDFCHEQLLRKMRRKISWTNGRTDGRTDRRTEVKQYIPFRGAGV